MKNYTQKINFASKSLGVYDYSNILDKSSRINMRRSIVTKRDIKKGEKATWLNLDYKRPYGGIDPSSAEKIVGRKFNKSLKKDQLIKFTDFQ